MIRRLIILLLILNSSFAQNLPPQSEIKKMNASEKILLYENNIKNPSKAITYSLLLSSYGHKYVGKWRKGLLFTSAEAGFSLLGLYELVSGCMDQINPYGSTNCEISSSAYVFFGLSGFLKIWEIIDAGKEAKTFNRKLYKSIYGEEPPSISLYLEPAYQGVNLTMSYAFD